jgi:glycogen debranching enzyme
VTLPVQVGAPTVTINRDDRFVVCQPDARIEAGSEEGFFARDTRFISAWELLLNGRRPILLNSSPVRYFSSRFEMTNDDIVDAEGPVSRRSIWLRLDRTVSGGVHEDLDLVNFGRRSVRLTIEIEIDSDFADLFDVKWHRLVRRGTLDTRWSSARRRLRTTYANGTFRRELVVLAQRSDSVPQFANGRLIFVMTIPPKGRWHTCLKWLPITASSPRPATLPCHDVLGPEVIGPPGLPQVAITTSNGTVRRAWDQAVADMEALRLEDPAAEPGVYIAAAGVPWFVTLFGRDSLVVAMQGIAGYPEFAAGALARLSQLQATRDDPERDMEPGKIAHEIRHGELSDLGLLPYTPYYGTHDATSLFVIVLSFFYHWTGDRSILERYLPAVEAAMDWIDRYGDRDGDGFQEYRTRSSHGYYNQGWKDAGDAIPAEDGSLAPLPLAVVELQGYAYDAKLRMADIYRVLGRDEEARRLSDQAHRIYDRVNDAFWWESEGTYYLGLDGDKRPIRSVASNAGHLLGSGIVPPERAGRVVNRLMADDMWSGWGIRTLSSEHPAYDPFSYHTGSVWPHDNAFIAGGFRRYGYVAQASQVAHGIFNAAERFVAYRLPELFAGLPRDPGGFPVQYLGANVPQAWAASAVFRLVALLVGLHARSDPEHGRRLFVNPALPDWLPELTLWNLRAGKGSLSLRMTGNEVETLDNTSGFEVVHGPAPRREFSAGPPEPPLPL